MKIKDIKPGKKYIRTTKGPGGGGRKQAENLVYTMLVIQVKETEVLASIIPEYGAATAPMWYPKEQVQRWKKKN